MRAIRDMVQQEVLCCMSSMVSTLAQGYGAPAYTRPSVFASAGYLADLIEQAFELASPIPDYEEAAIQAGWKQITPAGDNAWYRNDRFPGQPDQTKYAATAEQACELDGIDPYDREVFEHWAVTDWFADKLIAQGEKVDKDFAGLCVWARTTTGAAIHADDVIERIYAETRDLK